MERSTTFVDVAKLSDTKMVIHTTIGKGNHKHPLRRTLFGKQTGKSTITSDRIMLHTLVDACIHVHIGF